MKCVQCGEEGAERMEIEFESGAVVVTYICPKCTVEKTDDQEIAEITSSPN